ncbi:S-adenosyl-L-methionine-dependent methyltransferase [Cadophora sp. DSE1049]|nr:S-adenosyl-L-methionine-dependent methyltransferase [Cadophora sp. DSE1049]
MAAQGTPLEYDFGPDEEEIYRLTIQHEIFKSAYSPLVLAPIDLSQPGLKILDSATADGLWLRDLQCNVATPHSLVGTDINPNFFPRTPTDNITFQVQDITKPWPAELNGQFDLVHSRNGLACCGSFPVSEAVENIVGLVKPRGWIQLVEMSFEGVTDSSGPMYEFKGLLDAFFSKAKAQWNFANRLEGWLVEAGLVDVKVKIAQLPYGKACNNEEIAKKSLYAFRLGSVAVCGAAKGMGVEGFTSEQLDSLPERLDKYLTEHGAKVPVVCVWGRKPL